MTKLDEETALAIVFANTRRKRRTADLITVAESFEYLVKLYGSRKAVAQKVGLSTEMVREFLKVLALPDEVKELVTDRQIERLDVVREISMLKDPKEQIAAAKTIANLSSKDIRDIRRLAQRANLPVEESKRMVLDSKPKGLHIFIMDLDDETYEAIIKEAKSRDVEPAELAKKIIMDWLAQRRRPRSK